MIGRPPELPSALPVLYRDERVAVVDKPPGLLTHRSAWASDRRTALEIVRDQLGLKVWPLHRLDRKTSGALAFALDEAVVGPLSGLFHERAVEKSYLAIVRGWMEAPIELDYPLNDPETDQPQAAQTSFRPLATTEQPYPASKFPTARYTLVEARPHSGRWHQLRRHLTHLKHPIIGDTTHGDLKQNRAWRENRGGTRLWLHAWRLAWPTTAVGGEAIAVEAPLEAEMARHCADFGWVLPGAAPVAGAQVG